MPRLFISKKRVYFTVVLIFIASSIHSQSYQFRNFGIEEGIPHRNVRTINQDPSGYLWIGTSTELCRFNGFEFESNPTGDSLPQDFVTQSFLDSRGRLWFGHYTGSLSVLEDNRVRIVDNQGIRTLITAIREDHEGNILVASQKGLLVVDDRMNTVLYNANFTSITISAFEVSGEDELIIGTFEGLYRYGYTPGTEPEMKELIASVPRVAISDIRSYKDKGILVGTMGRGIFHLTKTEGGMYNAINTGEYHGFGYADVESSYMDDLDNLWISTRGQGVFKIENYFGPGGYTGVKNFSSSNGMPADFVHSVFQDFEGNYWFTTNNGLSMLADEAFSFFRSFDEPFGKNVLAVHSDNNHIWLGGESGMLRISKQNTRNRLFFGTGRGLPFDRVTAIATSPENNIWIGTANSGIFRLGHGEQRAAPFHVSANSLENTINDLTFSGGVLRAATGNGVLEFNLLRQETRHYTTDGGLPHNFIRSIHTDNTGINWISTRSNSLVDTESRRSIRIATIELDFTAVTQDYRGRIWTATNGNGIIKITNDTIIQISTDEGLHSNYCYGIISGPDNKIWVGHRLGISRVDPDSYHVSTYGTESSIRGDINSNAAHITAEGVLLFGTTEGLVLFDAGNERARNTPPLLNITSLQISDEEHEFHDRISLPYGRYKFRIEFMGLNYSDPEKVQYQYKLEGYDMDWSDVSGYRFALYPRLEDGNFEFLLRAYNAMGVASEVPLSLKISIGKPIWKKWYFFMFILISGGLLLLLIIKIRERNLRLEKERIERELAIRTREVFEQKAEIEHKNRDITDSINYAQRIQASILPPISKIEENFNESFLFYQPRDIVSGDFYWFDKVNENKFLIVCADSTGHGVPGAFMSMIGTTLIKDICMRTDISSPSDVLETLDREITRTLNQSVDPTGKTTDGMDITVCEFDTKTRYLRFASAMRPIMMLHKGELTYIRGSRNSIGGYYTENKAFENQGFQLDPGDIVYLFSDGYPDQFGGPVGKKYKMVRLKNLLADICNKPMNEQYDQVKNDFNIWKGEYEQVDDVLFMGIKV